MAEELLNALAHVEGLRVIGRSSSALFGRAGEDFRTVGQKLGVAHVLEGSVRTEGPRIRVTARLVRVADGSCLWSENYQLDLTGVFSMQDAITTAVVVALRDQLLTVPRRLSPPPTTSPEAYTRFLRARREYYAQNPASLRSAVSTYEEALQLDPAYAPAWAGLSMALANDGLFVATAAEARALGLRAVAAADWALALVPELCDGLSARGMLRQIILWDWEGGLADLSRAARLYAGDADAVRRLGNGLFSVGRIDEALATLERAVSLDPLGVAVIQLGECQMALGDLVAARTTLERAAALRPDSFGAAMDLASLCLLEGKAEEALARFSNAPDSIYQLSGVAMSLHALGRREEATAALARLEARPDPLGPEGLADYYAWTGNADRAFSHLERSVRQRLYDFGWPIMDPFLRPLHGDSRWREFLRSMRLPDQR